MSLGISIPMYNEEGNVERVLQRCQSHLKASGIDFYIAAVNNGSTDGTGSTLDELSQREPRIIAIHLSSNQGYGGGILAGMNSLMLKNLDVVGWTWGDGQVCSTVLPRLYQECMQGADIAKACRIQRQDGYRRRFISKTYSMIMKMTGTRNSDLNGCPKLFRNDFYRSLELQSKDWFIDAEAMLKAEGKNAAIYQEPVIMEPRFFGESKVRMSTILEFTKNIIVWKLKRY